MYNSWFQKIMLLLVVVGGINWGIYGIWGINAIGWLLGGSLGWLARTIFIVVGVASLVLIPALFYQAPEARRTGPEPHAP